MHENTRDAVAAYVGGGQELKDVVALSPKLLTELKARAQYFVDSRLHERALILLDMLAALDRNDRLVALVAIDVLLDLGRSPEAEERASRLVVADPDFVDGWVALAKAQLAQGQMHLAARALEHAQILDPQASTPAGKMARAVAAMAFAQYEAQFR